MNQTTSKINSQYSLEYMITQAEGQYLERKGLGENDLRPTKIADELIGMLNASGGLLVFGLADDGEIQDLHSLGEEKLRGYRTLIIDFISPTPNVELEELTLNGGELLFLYHVEPEFERVFSRVDNQ
ncbi:MAG: helix-turn-helix domain-containing protein [Mangrovibacterium sp.]